MTRLAVVREALASAWSQPVASMVTIMIVAGMCATVFLTTGRTVAAEQAVLSTIDSAGTRSIVVRAEPAAGLDATVLERIIAIDGIEWVGAFAAATDVQNVAIEGGTRVPTRLAWGSDWEELGIPSVSAVEDSTIWATDAALEMLGLATAAGGVQTDQGAQYVIGGRLDAPDFLEFLEPLAIAPQNGVDEEDSLSVLVVLASKPELVVPVSAAVQSVLALDDPTKVSVTTSEDLATLRGLIQGQLGAFGRELVIVIFAVTAVLVGAILFGLVMLRRKDFGRRRALGASQSLIVALLLTQVAALSALGAVLGTVVVFVSLLLVGEPVPGLAFTAAIDVLAVGVGMVSALVPALAAARRDPLVELRVP